MQKVIFTIGIPGSGKSTWARAFARDNPQYFISERDLIRAELYGSGDILNYKYSRGREKEVTKTQLDRILNALDVDCSVIISDTNLNREQRQVTRAIIRAKYPDVEFENKVFDTSLKTCIQRNMKRHASVPESAMVRMEMKIREHLGKVRHQDTVQDSYPHCIIVDIDGTVADMKGIRKPYEWHRVGEDNPIVNVINLIHGYMENVEVDLIFFSGRDSVCMPETITWLNQYFFNYQLYMRPEGSQIGDDIVKEKLYIDHVHCKYNVDFVMDDRKQVVQLWESMGLKVINVGGTLSDF